MEWKMKVKLATLLNNGESDKACELVLNNDMDLQAWDMFLTGVDLRDSEHYKPLLPKLKENRNKIIGELKMVEALKLGLLIAKLEE